MTYEVQNMYLHNYHCYTILYIISAKELSVYLYLLLQHNQWQRMSQNPGAELIEDFVLYQHTVTYRDNTIIIMDALNNSIVVAM